MTLDQIITLKTIVDSGSFKAASEKLFKTQPSLSMAIKKLEEEFEIQLFDREGYRPKLTEQGEAFLKQSRKFLTEAAKLEKLGKELSAGHESEITICIDAIFPISMIAHGLQGFFEPHITTQLNLRTDVLEGVYKSLHEQSVDFALGPDMGEHDDIEKIKILDCDIVPVISSKYAAEQSLELLKELPQVIVESSDPSQRGVIRGAISDNFWFTSDFYMKEQLISSGLGWGRLPLHQIKHQLKNNELVKITEVSSIKALKVPMYLLRSKSKVFGPNTKNLWNYLKSLEI